MGPCTVEPVAGATAWALARWATLREAQPVFYSLPALSTQTFTYSPDSCHSPVKVLVSSHTASPPSAHE
ncbi:hypothetical protein PAMP_006072 [Pampus punctatissimus]